VEFKNAASSENNQKALRLWGWHTWLSIALALVILVFLAMMIDLKEVWRRIAACNKEFVLLGALAHYATYPVRGLRWRRCLVHQPLRAGRGKFGLLVFFYNFVDNVVPAKLGDLYAAHLARINCGISRSTALGSIVFLRMVDAWVVLLLAALASWALFSARLPRTIVWGLLGGGAIAVAASSIMLTSSVLKKSLPRWLPQKVQEIMHAFHTGMWPRSREVVPIAVLTLLIWTLEVLWIFFLARGFGLKLSLAEAIFLTMLPLLATAFPFTPSGTGVVELTLFSCLRAVSVSAPVAASLTIVNRFIDHWLHIGLGLVIWAVSRGIGLRTWREAPLEETPSATSPDTSLSPEVLHAS
jgi:uncharacterized protein (TIRG00374 family)